jgi:serine/threonine protein kinase
VGNCPSNDELLDFVDGRLSSADASALVAHVDACPLCHALVAELTRDAAETPAPRFRTVELLGSGAMADVFRAVDNRNGRTVALKLLKPQYGDDREVRARFGREARAAMALGHPNIAEVIDTGELDGQPFIAMAFCAGETLRQRLMRGPLSVATALRLLIQLTDGIAAAHAQGIVHRDLKPSNLFITSDGVLKILDFGLAKLSAAPLHEGTLTATGALLGTLPYMAPEQVRGNAVDTRADLWAVGVIAYEMLSGTSPFSAERAEGTLVRVLQGQLRGLRQLRDDVPRALDRLILGRLLQRALERRMASARALATALGRISVPASDSAPSLPRDRRPLVAIAAPEPRSQKWALWSLAVVASAIAVAGWRASIRAEWRPRVRDVLREELERVTDLSLSRDGKLVAFDMRRNGAERVWIANRDGSQLHAVTSDGYTSPQFTPDDKGLFVLRSDGNVLRLDLATATLSPLHPAITLPPSECGPGTLVWVDRGTSRIMQERRDGTTAELVPADEAHPNVPEISCDAEGQRLLYAAGRWDLSDMQLWLVHLDSGKRERLLGDMPNVFTARFNGPDKLVLAQGTLDQAHLWEATLEGKRRRQLTFGAEHDDSPRFGQDGSFLYAVSHVVGAVFANSDRTAVRQLTYALGSVSHLIATPDDRALVLERLHLGHYQATRLLIDSGEETLLVDDSRPLQIRGDQLLYTRPADGDALEIWAVPLAGGPSRRLWSLHGDQPYVDAEGTLHYRAWQGCQPRIAMRCRLGGAPEREAPDLWQLVIPAPSGGWVAALRHGRPSLALFAPGTPLDGAPAMEVAIESSARHPLLWSRDGRSLFYIARGRPELRQRRVDTGEDKVLLASGSLDAFAVLPEAKVIFHAENQVRVRIEAIDNFAARPSL